MGEDARPPATDDLLDSGRDLLRSSRALLDELRRIVDEGRDRPEGDGDGRAGET